MHLTYHVNVVNDDKKDKWNEIQVDFVFDEEFKRISGVSMIVVDRKLEQSRIGCERIVDDQVFEFERLEENVEMDENLIFIFMNCYV